MTPEDAEEYTQALGQVISGGWRQIALAERLGVPQALGMTTREWVEKRLGGYVRMSIPERREAVKELAAEGMSQRQIAAVLGVDPMTVNHDLRRRVENSTPAAGGEGGTREDAGTEAPRVENSTPVAVRPRTRAGVRAHNRLTRGNAAESP